jgi:hypothetical protein
MLASCQRYLPLHDNYYQHHALAGEEKKLELPFPNVDLAPNATEEATRACT